MPLLVLTSRSAFARCVAAEYSPDGSAVASVRSPFTSTLPALGACAGALVIGGSVCIDPPPSTGTSVTFALAPPSACSLEAAGCGGVCDAFACDGSEPWTSEPTTNAMMTSATNAITPRIRLRMRVSGGGTYAGAAVAVVAGTGRTFTLRSQLQYTHERAFASIGRSHRRQGFRSAMVRSL